MKAMAPGKLILSGEHAVLYGQPALAMAVNRYASATISSETKTGIFFHLSDLVHHSYLSRHALRQVKNKIKSKYHRFIRGELGIREVLKEPFELAQFAMSILTEARNLTLPRGVKVQVQSDIPIGCGMGSSAATILSVMHAISQYWQLSLTPDALLQLALEVENAQHGYSSGLDLYVALHGGCWWVQGNDRQPRPLPSLPLYLVNTGIPRVSTGQCVEKVAPHFQSTALRQDFAAVTQAMDMALQQNNPASFPLAIRANHQLLVGIGVVPLKVQQFVEQIQALSGAAKICGAGAILGDEAGVVLVTAIDQAELASLCMRFGYSLMPIQGQARGLHAV